MQQRFSTFDTGCAVHATSHLAFTNMTPVYNKAFQLKYTSMTLSKVII